MKNLKFYPHLIQKILTGEKTSTWRLFDDKNLAVDDELVFISTETGEKFGGAKITKVVVRMLGKLTDSDWEGHERFVSEEEMYETYKKYYGNKVDPDTEVKIISFDFKKS